MYILIKKETGNKTARFIYTVIEDATGAVLSGRKSNREYVAATICGRYYFGRLDLIGKGDHGRFLKTSPYLPIAYLKQTEEPETNF